MTKSVAAASPTNLEALLLLSALATAPDEVSYAAGLLRAWHGDDTKRAEHRAPRARETWLPLAALYDRLHEGESAAVARAEAKHVGLKNIGLALNLANVYFSLERLQPAEELLLAATKALPIAPRAGCAWRPFKSACASGKTRAPHSRTCLPP